MIAENPPRPKVGLHAGNKAAAMPGLLWRAANLCPRPQPHYPASFVPFAVMPAFAVGDFQLSLAKYTAAGGSIAVRVSICTGS